MVSAVALQAPSRVRSLTLMAPAGFSTGIDADYVRGFAAASSRRELKPMLSQLFASEDLVTRQLVDDVLKYKRLDGVDAALRALQGTLLTDGGAGSTQALDLAGRLAELDVPVTVVWGGADRIIPPPSAPPGPWPLRVVDGAGHMVHMESPHAVLEVIEGVIAQPR